MSMMIAISSLLMIPSVPVGTPTGSAAQAPKWQWKVEMAHPASKTKSHIHAASWDTDGSAGHLFVGCQYAGASATAVQFYGGGPNASVGTLTSGSSQVYGIRGRSAAGVIQASSMVWQAAAWYNNGSTWGAPKILHSGTWKKSMATDVDGYKYGGGTDTACGSVVLATPLGKEIPGRWNCSSGAWTPLPFNPTKYRGGRCSSIDIHFLAGSLFLTGPRAAPHAAKWGDRALNTFLPVDLHPTYLGFSGSMANDTFGFNTVGVVGNWTSIEDDSENGYLGWINGGHAALWGYSNQFCDLHSSTYSATSATAISGNAVVGWGDVGTGVNAKRRALSWNLSSATGTQPPIPVQLPTPLNASGVAYKHCEAWDVVAGGNFIVGVAFDTFGNGAPAGEHAVIWSLVYE